MSSINFKYKSSMSSVGAYQVSGVPFLSASSAVIQPNTGNPHQVSFPYISQWVIIENTGGQNLRIAFCATALKGNGAGAGSPNYFVLNSGSAKGLTGGAGDPRSRIKLDLRVRDIFLLSDSGVSTTAQIAAGLTPISTSSLTFGNWTGSLGVG